MHGVHEDSVIGFFNFSCLSGKMSCCFHHFMPSAAVRHIWLIYFSIKQTDKLTYGAFSAMWRKKSLYFCIGVLRNLNSECIFLILQKCVGAPVQVWNSQSNLLCCFVESFVNKSYETINREGCHCIGVEGCHLHWITRISFCPMSKSIGKIIYLKPCCSKASLGSFFYGPSEITMYSTFFYNSRTPVN